MRSFAISGHSFTSCFTANKPLKRSIIPLSQVLQEDISDGNTEMIVLYLSMNLTTH